MAYPNEQHIKLSSQHLIPNEKSLITGNTQIISPEVIKNLSWMATH